MSNGSSAAAGAFLNLNGSHLRQDCTLRFECVHFCASLYSACVSVACTSACVCTSVRSACLHARACVFVCARARGCPFMRVGFVCACAFTCLEVRAICITERHGRRANGCGWAACMRCDALHGISRSCRAPSRRYFFSLSEISPTAYRCSAGLSCRPHLLCTACRVHALWHAAQPRRQIPVIGIVPVRCLACAHD